MGFGSQRRTARTRTPSAWSACSSARATRRSVGCSSVAAASGSTRCSTIPRSTSVPPVGSALARPSSSRCCSTGEQSAFSSRTTGAGPDPAFGEDDLRLAESLGSRASIAVDLSQRVSRDAVRRVVEAQELERARLARELHDETGQALTSILLGLKSLEDQVDSAAGREAASEVRELVVSTLQDVRRLAVELRPTALDDFGLVPALERLAEMFSSGSGIEVDLDARLGEERLPADVETMLYRLRAGGAHERRQACIGPARHGRAGAGRRRRHGDGRGRRQRVRPCGGERPARPDGGCANASASSAGGSPSTLPSVVARR